MEAFKKLLLAYQMEGLGNYDRMKVSLAQVGYIKLLSQRICGSNWMILIEKF